MSDKKNDEKRTAVIRFADRYFILVSFVYSLKCRIPTNTPNFVYFCCGCGFCCCRMIHDQLCFICILFFLEKKKYSVTYTNGKKICVVSFKSMAILCPSFAFYVIITFPSLPLCFLFSKNKWNQLFSRYKLEKHTHMHIEIWHLGKHSHIFTLHMPDF